MASPPADEMPADRPEPADENATLFSSVPKWMSISIEQATESILRAELFDDTSADSLRFRRSEWARANPANSFLESISFSTASGAAE